VRGRLAGVEGEEERDRYDHPAEPRGDRQRQPTALAQLAHVELPPRLEPDDEEEERHQPAVQPAAEILRDAVSAEADRERRVPDALVRGLVDVDPEERGDRGGEQQGCAPGLGA